jgi:hypothetical protein
MCVCMCKDTNFYAVTNSRTLLDVVDEAWQIDCLSDDGAPCLLCASIDMARY